MRLFSDVASRVDDPHLSRAAALAQRALGRTWPNPTVGCVVVRDGQVVGEGRHPRAGEPHAEIFALSAAGPLARGADVYLTLEPCAHHGKTPPCADALIAAGVARVVIGMSDPNPDAAGGAARLRAAGIAVEFSPDRDPFVELNAGWLKRVSTGMPRTTAKCGVSLDACVAFETGVRAAITGPSGAEVTQRLRSRADAVLVSAATVRADDPALTVRDEHGVLAEYQPVRVVLARRELPPADARIFTDGVAPSIILASDAVDPVILSRLSRTAQIARWEANGAIGAALRALGDLGMGEVLVEPGPRLLSAMWESGTVDELVTVTGGGMAGDCVSLFSGAGDRAADGLVRRMMPLETGIVGDVSVTVWGACERSQVQ